MAVVESEVVAVFQRARDDLFWIAGRCGSSLQTSPHCDAFLANNISLRAVRGSLTILGDPLPVLRGAFESDTVSGGRGLGRKTSLGIVTFQNPQYIQLV